MPKITRPTKPLADVSLPNPDKNADNEVVICFQPDRNTIWGNPEANANAVLALDASRSIKRMFGTTGVFGGGEPNYVEMVSRKVGEILCDVTKKGDVSMLYWALGPGGENLEDIGSFERDECETCDISGPNSGAWGTGTKILPPIKKIVEEHFDVAEATMGVIVTDGIIEDEKEAMDYCLKLGKRLIDEGKTESFKLVLIGVGEEVDEGQLERFDDMFEDDDDFEGDEIDIWAHGVAAHMKDEADILDVLFGEMMSEDTIIADSGSVLDSSGNEIKSFSDGLPGKFRFVLPKGESSFTIHTPGGEVTQDVSELF